MGDMRYFISADGLTKFKTSDVSGVDLTGFAEVTAVEHETFDPDAQKITAQKSIANKTALEKTADRAKIQIALPPMALDTKIKIAVSADDGLAALD